MILGIIGAMSEELEILLKDIFLELLQNISFKYYFKILLKSISKNIILLNEA